MTSAKLSKIIIVLAVLAAILVPALTLFNEGDYLYCTIGTAENIKMMVEVVVLGILIGAASAFIKVRRTRFLILGAITLVFSYIHSMLLPVIAAGIYFLAVISFSNIVTGASVAIIIESILSLLGLGGAKKMGVAVLALAVLYTAYRVFIRKQKLISVPYDDEVSVFPKSGAAATRLQLLVNGAVLLIVLIQIGRASLAVKDFDSLWYGLRSEYVLAPGGNIFEDLGLVGMVYTYSKGFEILTIPLNAFRSYAYVPVFNICLLLLGFATTYKIARHMVKKDSPFAYLAVIITAVIPGIVNMSVSAKPDIITWLLQLIMIERFFCFVATKDRSRRISRFLQILAAYLLSLTMKPTAVIFSTALAGMMLIWWIIDLIKTKSADNGVDDDADEAVYKGVNEGVKSKVHLCPICIAGVITSSISLCFVWARTIKLTGVPFTSVFTGVLTAIGFELKYPFTSRSLPQSYQEGSAVLTAVKRIARMLLSPEGDDMSHVIIAWGGSIMLVLAVVIIICIVMKIIRRSAGEGTVKMAGTGAATGKEKTMTAGATAGTGTASATEVKAGTGTTTTAAILFIPYAMLCFITLMMLYQVDGNYYMTLYSIVIITAMWLCADVCDGCTDTTEPGSGSRKLYAVLAAAMILCQLLIVLITNWASQSGFTPIAFNKLYYDNEADARVEMTTQASPEAIASGTTIYDILAAQPHSRVVAVAEHPKCFQLRCVTQSYNDITMPWGNGDLVESADAFIDYIHFAKVDYIFADTEFLSYEECEWRAGLLKEMEERGLLYDYIHEGNYWLARVR